jgi:hypothetical protein
MMMEDFPDYAAEFHKTFGKPARYAEWSTSDHNRLDGRLPASLLAFLAEDGFAAYKGQSLWMCDPDQMHSEKSAWLQSFPKAEIFMRTAFGDMFFWDGKNIWSCLVHLSSIVFAANNMSWFLGHTLHFKPFLRTIGVPGFTNKGQKVCGPLKPDEVYIWNPALALGGSSESSAIEKGDMHVALDILSQLQPISVQNIDLT